MATARPTPRYTGVVDSGRRAPIVDGPAYGPQLVPRAARAASTSVPAAEDAVRPAPPAGRTSGVLSMLGRRPSAMAVVAADESRPARRPLGGRAATASVVPVARRPWRVLIVSAAPGAMPRSFEVSRLQARVALGLLGVMAVLSVGVVAAVGVAVRSPSLLGRSEVQALEAELAATRDSLAWERVPAEDSGALAAGGQGASDASPAAAPAATAPALAGAAAPAPATVPTPAPPVVAATAAAVPAPRPASPRPSPSTSRAGSGSAIRRHGARSGPASVEDAELETDGVLSLVPRSISDLPVIGAMVSGFSHARRHPLLHRVRPHLGVDLAAPRGTRVSAPAPGVVTFVGHRFGFGLVVELDHGAGVTTRYAHLRSAAVQKGETVRRGEAIAAVGTSGVTTGPHLHYEVMVHGRQVDPLRVRFGRADASVEAGAVLAGHPAAAGGVAPGAAATTGGTHEAAPLPPR